MTASVIDGKKIASLVRSSIKEIVAQKLHGKRAPGLGVILVGENPASKVYVASKGKMARECGFETFDIHLPDTASFSDVADAIKSFNKNEAVDGILLQLPLPKGLDSDTLISMIDPAKDADGLHPMNQGLLLQGRAKLKPCTPAGCIELLKESGVQISGKNAVVVGRSILVGKPAALLLLEENATVTIAHSRTKNLSDVVKNADIVVAAVGITEFIKGSWIKDGAAVIDVGINRQDNGQLKGDVEYEASAQHAAFLTPVPGGVGPMTIAMLLKNTLTAYAERNHLTL